MLKNLFTVSNGRRSSSGRIVYIITNLLTSWVTEQVQKLYKLVLQLKFSVVKVHQYLNLKKKLLGKRREKRNF